MTDNNVVGIHIARLSLSRITYNCDLQHSSELIIPLGAFAEITVGPIRSLGLIARTDLFPDEQMALGSLVRDKLSTPFDYLLEEFKWAWNSTKTGEALQKLSNKHSESLFISPPVIIEKRHAWPNVIEAICENARDEMRKQRDDHFLELLCDTWTTAKPVPQEDAAKLKAA